MREQRLQAIMATENSRRQSLELMEPNQQMSTSPIPLHGEHNLSELTERELPN